MPSTEETESNRNRSLKPHFWKQAQLSSIWCGNYLYSDSHQLSLFLFLHLYCCVLLTFSFLYELKSLYKDGNWLQECFYKDYICLCKDIYSLCYRCKKNILESFSNAGRIFCMQFILNREQFIIKLLIKCL